MDTQNTPIHIRIWSRHFWMLVLANLLLGVSVFMLLPYIPAQMQADGYTLRDVGLVMLAFGLGIVIPGPYVSYFIERFRRNKVCLLSILLLVVFSAILYEADVQKVFHIGFSGTLAVRVLQGFCYGLTEWWSIARSCSTPASRSTARRRATCSPGRAAARWPWVRSRR